MPKTIITAEISYDTKAEVETYLSKNSLSMDELLEAALQHYFEALKGIPENVVVPSKLVITQNSMREVINLLENKREPKDSLKRLMEE